jgi:hypothetical protein
MVREGSEDEEWKLSVAPIPASTLEDLAAAAAEENSREESAGDLNRTRASAQGEEESDEEDQEDEFIKEVRGAGGTEDEALDGL